MKTHIRYLLIAVFSMSLLVGCKDVVYPTWDFPPWDVGLIVRNSAGENLLDPETTGNILDNDITITYNDEVYGLQDLDAPTRYIPSRWHGLRAGRCYFGDNDYEGTVALLLGEFSADTNEGYHGETFTVDWGDGTSDKIKFDLYVTYREKGKEATVHRKIWLNGELRSDNQLAVEIEK